MANYKTAINLGQRIDQCFGYDRLNRLVAQAPLAGTTCNLSPSSPTTISNSYNSLGNILTKGATSLNYEANTHRVNNAAGATNASYLYDANGQVTTKTSNNQTQNQTQNQNINISWTVFNQPESLTRTDAGSASNPASASLSYTYGAGLSRVIEANTIEGHVTYHVAPGHF